MKNPSIHHPAHGCVRVVESIPAVTDSYVDSPKDFSESLWNLHVTCILRITPVLSLAAQLVEHTVHFHAELNPRSGSELCTVFLVVDLLSAHISCIHYSNVANLGRHVDVCILLTDVHTQLLAYSILQSVSPLGVGAHRPRSVPLLHRESRVMSQLCLSTWPTFSRAVAEREDALGKTRKGRTIGDFQRHSGSRDVWSFPQGSAGH